MALNWTVNVLSGQNGNATVQPANMRSSTTVLNANAKDTVVWANQSSAAVQFYQTLGNQAGAGPDSAVPLCGPVQPGATSTPYTIAYPANATTQFYCNAAGGAQGSIATPAAPQYDWNVKIVSDGRGGVAFQPNVPNAAVGDPLIAQPGDIVSWRNDSTLPLRLFFTSPNAANGTPAATPFVPQLLPQTSSTPQYTVASTGDTVLYYCAELLTSSQQKWYGVIALAYL